MKTILRAAVSFVLATSAFIGSATAQTPPADLIVVNAKIWTGDEDQPGAEALAITDGRFVAVGDEMSVRAHIGDATRIIDAGGSRIIPGLIDTHVHLVNAAESLARLDLRMARSRTALLQMVSDYAATLDQDAWLIGRGWSAESWPDPKPPTADEIDDAAGGRPAVLIRMDGHSLLAGRSALEYANIDEQGPPDPTGGRIGRDAAGKPDGGVFGEAQGMIYSVIREDQSIARRRELLRSAMAHANGLGVTQIGALETQLGLHDLLIPMAREDLLTLRIDATISSAATRVDQWRPTLLWAAANREPGPGLRIIGFKGYMDGSLGSRNAWQTEPYLDDPGNPENTGNPRTMAVTGALPELIALGASMGLQPAVHAIGDQANHLLLDWYGDLPEAQRRALRPRIEHAQHLLPEDVSRFGALGVIPSMQPWHKADDGRYAEQRLGPERVKTSYAFRGLLDSGAALAFGSDWPVVTVNPFLGMHAAVNATTLDGAVFVPEQSISIEEALHAYTRAAAFCLHSEAQTGAIREGFEASFVILDRDLLAIDPSEIGEVRPVLTCVRGEVVFESDDR